MKVIYPELKPQYHPVTHKLVGWVGLTTDECDRLGKEWLAKLYNEPLKFAKKD